MKLKIKNCSRLLSIPQQQQTCDVAEIFLARKHVPVAFVECPKNTMATKATMAN